MRKRSTRQQTTRRKAKRRKKKMTMSKKGLTRKMMDLAALLRKKKQAKRLEMETSGKMKARLALILSRLLYL